MAVIADALVGELVGQLLGVVIEMKDKNLKFKSTLEKLQNTLVSIQPDVDKIVEQYRVKDQASQIQALVDLMKSGKKLVKECDHGFQWWNCFYKRANYQEKLQDLDDSIRKYFQLEMQAKIANNVMVIDDKVDELRAEVHNIAVIVKTSKNERIALKLCTAPAPPEFTFGLDVPLKDLKLRVLPDSVSVNVTTVTGSGGLGKTTLAKKFCMDEQVKDKFKENIFFVNFAKNPKLNTIVQNLFQHNGLEVPKFQGEEDAINEDAINKLGTLMNEIGKKGPILLVLDDVWLGSESLVDKFVFQIPNYNILVTSRSAITRYGAPYPLGRLSTEDATKLFRHSASLNSTEIPEKLVKKIVKACKRSPIALTVTGTSLRNKNLVVWRSRATALSKGILEADHDVLTCLQKSLDVLDDIAKECFKDLGLFPEDQRIPAAALVDILAELRCGDDETAMAKIYDLVNLNMADIMVTRKVASDIVDYNYHYISQHGLLRELAIRQTSQEPEDKRNRLIIEINENNLPDWWSVQKEYPTPAKILSISTDEKFSSEWCKLQPTEVEALVLNFRGKKCTLPMFMKNMKKLKVLTITNYDFYPAELENFKLLDHLPSLKRLRLEKVSIPFLSKMGVKLESLQKCSFFMCNVIESSDNCTTQVSDMLPKLLEIDFDYCTMVELPVVLSNSDKLKKLRITNCHKLSALPKVGNLGKLESLRLSSCSGLLELPEETTSLKKLQFLDISDCISLSNLPEDMGDLEDLEKLNVRGCSRLTELPTSIMDLENLQEVECDEEMAELWEPFKQVLSDLKLVVAPTDFSLDFLSNLRS